MKVINLIYKFEKFKPRNIKLFSKSFLKNNKKKFKLIIENKTSPLKERYYGKDYETEFVKVKLVIFDRTFLNFQNMFYGCNYLVEFYEEKKQKELIIENCLKEKQKEQIVNDQFKNDELNEKYKDFYDYENPKLNKESSNIIKSFYINKKAQKLYCYSNINNNSEQSTFKNDFQQSISIDASEICKRDSVINESASFLSKSYFFGLDKEKNLKRKNMNIKSIVRMFYGCSSLINLADISYWNITKVTNISCMFYKCSSLKSLAGISKWNTINITNMSNLFNGCSLLNPLPDISKWNTSKVESMSSMFRNCKSLISLPDLSQWNTKNLFFMDSMFNGCSSLNSLPILSKWNISKVKTMSDLFKDCSFLIALPDISNWDTSKVEDMSGLFLQCSSLLKLPNISKWNTANVTNMMRMFYRCSKLVYLPDISKWDISKVKNLSAMFYFCSSLLKLPDISKWNTENVYFMKYMFFGCSSLQSFPILSKWNTKNLLLNSYMFEMIPSELNIYDLNHFDNNKDIIFRYKNNNIKKEPTVSDKIEAAYNEYKLIYGVDDDIQIPPLFELSKISYKVDRNADSIRIFGEEFIKKHKGKAIIIYNDKIYPIKEYLPTKLIPQKTSRLVIIYRELTEIIDREYMFDNCTLLY